MLVWNPNTLFRLGGEVDPKVGMNLDPSHLFWKHARPIAAARALGDAIHHCHGRDTHFKHGLAVGVGHDLRWWKEFFSVMRMGGYNEWVSLEMEDLPRFWATLFGDVGGFGVGSGRTGQIIATVNHAVNDNIYVSGDYRWLPVDYDDDGTAFETTISGPLPGVTWRFRSEEDDG